MLWNVSADFTYWERGEIEDLPYNEIGVTGAADDDDDDIVTYLVVTNNPKGDLTVHDVDKVYYIILCNNPAFDYYGIVDYTNLNDYYIERSSKIRLDNTETVSYTHLDVYKRQSLHEPYSLCQ